MAAKATIAATHNATTTTGRRIDQPVTEMSMSMILDTTAPWRNAHEWERVTQSCE
jgi:hypothetical protein